jgi:hypothetical protein
MQPPQPASHCMTSMAGPWAATELAQVCQAHILTRPSQIYIY